MAVNADPAPGRALRWPRRPILRGDALCGGRKHRSRASSLFSAAGFGKDARRSGFWPLDLAKTRVGAVSGGQNSQRRASEQFPAAGIGKNARRSGLRPPDLAKTRVGAVSGRRIRQKRASERFPAARIGKDARRSGFWPPESAKTRVGAVSGRRNRQKRASERSPATANAGPARRRCLRIQGACGHPRAVTRRAPGVHAHSRRESPKAIRPTPKSLFSVTASPKMTLPKTTDEIRPKLRLTPSTKLTSTV